MDKSVLFRKASLEVGTDNVIPDDRLEVVIVVTQAIHVLEMLNSISQNLLGFHWANPGATLVVVHGIACEYLLVEEHVSVVLSDNVNVTHLCMPVLPGDRQHVFVDAVDHRVGWISCCCKAKKVITL